MRASNILLLVGSATHTIARAILPRVITQAHGAVRKLAMALPPNRELFVVGPGNGFGPDTRSELERLGAVHMYTTSFATDVTIPREHGVRLIHHFMHIPDREQDPLVFKNMFTLAMKREINVFFEIPFPETPLGGRITMSNVPGAPKGMVQESEEYKPSKLEELLGGKAGTPSSRGGFDNAWQADLKGSNKDGKICKVRLFVSALPDPHWIRDNADLIGERNIEWDKRGFKVVSVILNRIAQYRVIGEDDETFEADNAAVWNDFTKLIRQGTGERSDTKWADSSAMKNREMLNLQDQQKDIARYKKVQDKNHAATAAAQPQTALSMLDTVKKMLGFSTQN